MQLHSFVSYLARDMIRQHGSKEVLLREDIVFGIMPMAFKQMDRVGGNTIQPSEFYIQKTLSDPRAPHMLQVIKYVYDNHNKINLDDSCTLEEKKEMIMNSINVIKPFVEDLEKNYNYEKFRDEHQNSKRGILKIAHHIIENLELKIDDTKEVKKILNSLEKIEKNFWLPTQNGKIYPLISDLLEDIISLEFALYLDKTLIQTIITTWKEAVETQEKRNFFNFTAFSKMEFIEKVKFHRIRAFLLAEYKRTLDVNEKQLQNFMRHILYYDISNHKQTLPIGFDKINDIATRPFLLERTKIVLGEVSYD